MQAYHRKHEKSCQVMGIFPAFYTMPIRIDGDKKKVDRRFCHSVTYRIEVPIDKLEAQQVATITADIVD